MTKDEALKLALDALEAHADFGLKSDRPITAIKEALAQPEQEPVYPWFMKWNKCADFWAHYMCINEQAQEDRAYEAKRWIERMRQAAELKANTQKQWAEITPEEVMTVANYARSPKEFASGAAWANAKLMEKNT